MLPFRPLVVFAGSLVALPAAGQTWTVEASAGGATHESVAADVGTHNAMLGVRYDGLPWAYVTAGIPLGSESVPWASVGIGGRRFIPLGPLEAGLDLGANGHAYRVSDLEATGSGATLSALPLLAWAAGPVRLEAYSGGLLYHRRFGQGSELETATRTLYDSGTSLAFAAQGDLLLRLDGRYLRAEEGNYPYVGGSVSYGSGPLQVWAGVGQWRFDSGAETGWEAGAQLGLNRATRVFASFADEPTDPIYFSLPRQRWTIGISRTLGSPPPSATPTAVPVAAAGALVTFSVPLDLAGDAPSIAGDFTDWEPRPMRREGGAWVIQLALEPGLHHYAFIRPDGSWFVPEWLPSVDDGFGGTSAVIVVR
ncbi:MAG: glycogen-binding domain-containing protein [Gemmatimonadota bacterium]